MKTTWLMKWWTSTIQTYTIKHWYTRGFCGTALALPQGKAILTATPVISSKPPLSGNYGSFNPVFQCSWNTVNPTKRAWLMDISKEYHGFPTPKIWGKISVDDCSTFNRTWPRAGRTIPPPWAGGLETATGSVVCELEMKQTQMGKTVQVS